MLEIDVERAFMKWLQTQPGYQVLGRQVGLPFGKLDVLAIFDSGSETWPVIAEIKLGKIDPKAYAQLLAYMEQVRCLAAKPCMGYLVGDGITPMALRLVDRYPMIFVSYRAQAGNIELNTHYAVTGNSQMNQFVMRGALRGLVEHIDERERR